MSSAFYSVLQASTGGSVQIITLSLVGALLSKMGHWNSTLSTNLSRCIYKVFIPSLVFAPVMSTVSTVRHRLAQGGLDFQALSSLVVPFGAAWVILPFSAIFALPIASFLGRGKSPLCRTAMWISMSLGNANTLVMLVMQSLCDVLPLFQTDPKCFEKATAYVAIYVITFTMFCWACLFPMLMHSAEVTHQYMQQVSHRPPSEHSTIVARATSTMNMTPDTTPPPPSGQRKLWDFLNKTVFCPPSISVLSAGLLALIPGFPEFILASNGVMQPFLASIHTTGLVGIYVASMIVGAELYEALRPRDRNESNLESNISTPGKESEGFGRTAIVVVVLVRLVLLPLAGRWLYAASGLSSLIQNPVLGAFVLAETNTTSANNSMIMVAIVSDGIPGGRRVRRDVALVLFIQYILSVVLLTGNTMANLTLIGM